LAADAQSDARNTNADHSLSVEPPGPIAATALDSARDAGDDSVDGSVASHIWSHVELDVNGHLFFDRPSPDGRKQYRQSLARPLESADRNFRGDQQHHLFVGEGTFEFLSGRIGANYCGSFEGGGRNPAAALYFSPSFP
jgi:hypothetical protein